MRIWYVSVKKEGSPSAELFLDQNKKTVCVKRGEKKICGELKNCGKLMAFIRQFDEVRYIVVIHGYTPPAPSERPPEKPPLGSFCG